MIDQLTTVDREFEDKFNLMIDFEEVVARAIFCDVILHCVCKHILRDLYHDAIPILSHIKLDDLL